MTHPPTSTAYYSNAIAAFRSADPLAIIGGLTTASGLGVEGTQIDAWKQQIEILQTQLADIDGSIFLEFDVPRLGSRIDGVILSKSAVIPIEFKVGESRYLLADYNQAWDYALDLKNFHRDSHTASIYPILCATQAPDTGDNWGSPHADGVYPPIRCNASNIREAIASAIALSPDLNIDTARWGNAPYHPSPTIIEAARALYARHSVASIARNDAGARNLHKTSHRVEQIIEDSRNRREKCVIFVTGVPGAGKTLVGLNIATLRRNDDETHAVFLSGNGPLVSVLREALVEDDYKRNGSSGRKERKGAIRQRVKPFIQNVHHFRDAAIQNSIDPPVEHVAIFDEAQRAWDLQKTAQFMKQRKGHAGFDMSEPRFLLSYMDRHTDWATVVCLVGGGQEIHTGEAGIGEWLDVVRQFYPNWRVYISPRLHDAEYAAGQPLVRLQGHAAVTESEDLHLAVSMRSFRSEQVSGFVKAVLDSDVEGASSILRTVQVRYPIVMTRNLQRGKQWVRDQARGSERYGMVASSQALRLKAYCVDVRVDVDPVKYFLADRDDTRSSFYLEDAATEFQIQGLELDWVCVNWDADLRRTADSWSYHAFSGSRWTTLRKEERQRYLVNSYRVLLTRARQGMAIFIPRGNDRDPTILPGFYEGTADLLRSVGVPEI